MSNKYKLRIRHITAGRFLSLVAVSLFLLYISKWLVVSGNAVIQLEELGVTCASSHSIRSGAFSKSTSAITGLNLSKASEIKHVGELIAQLPEVFSVSVENRQIDEDWWNSICRVSKLEILALEGCIVSAEGLDMLRHSGNLRAISLSDSSFNEDVVKEVAEISSIEKVVLTGSSMNADWLPRLLSMPSIKILALSRTSISELELQKVTECQRLEFLYVSERMVENPESFIKKSRKANPDLCVIFQQTLN